jgi:hypothetical protein
MIPSLNTGLFKESTYPVRLRHFLQAAHAPSPHRSPFRRPGVLSAFASEAAPAPKTSLEPDWERTCSQHLLRNLGNTYRSHQPQGGRRTLRKALRPAVAAREFRSKKGPAPLRSPESSGDDKKFSPLPHCQKCHNNGCLRRHARHPDCYVWLPLI